MAIDRENLIAFVKETHRLAGETDVVERSKAARDVSEKTAADYGRVGRSRLNMSDKSGGRLLEGVSRQSWDHHRAALRHEAARMFAEHRRACDEAQRKAGDAQRNGNAVSATMALEEAAKQAKAARVALVAFKDVTGAVKPLDRTASRKSKRSVLPKADDWQERAWQAATPAMRPALVCGWVGARPDEIEHGVRIVMKEDYILVGIKGAKVTNTSGQPSRVLTFSRDGEIGKKLAACVPDGKEIVTVKRNAKRISLDWSQRIRPRIGGKASAYSLRHQFAANMKSAGMDPIDIAKALGHLSVKSQGRYGSKQQGQSGGIGLLDVVADREIKTGPAADSVVDYDPTPTT